MWLQCLSCVSLSRSELRLIFASSLSVVRWSRKAVLREPPWPLSFQHRSLTCSDRPPLCGGRQWDKNQKRWQRTNDSMWQWRFSAFLEFGCVTLEGWFIPIKYSYPLPCLLGNFEDVRGTWLFLVASLSLFASGPEGKLEENRSRMIEWIGT